jgi:outer membrane protein
MKSLNKLFFIFLFFFLNISQGNSNEPIAYIDMDFVIKNSNIGKKTFESINILIEISKVKSLVRKILCLKKTLIKKY